MADDVSAEIASHYRAFADEAADESPLYGALAAAVADDEDVVAFLARLPRAKRQPVLLFPALQYLGAAPADPDDLRRRVLQDGERLASAMRARATQTNEPARCAALVPLLAAFDQPLALIEVGASAGLCLYPDRHSYEFDGRPVGLRSAVHLASTTTGEGPLPRTLPRVVARIGVDLNPLDPADADDRAWLRALVWPGPRAADRLSRLDAATAIARADPPVLLRGDLLDRLPEALDLVPSGATPVVFSTAVLPYLPAEARAAFVALVRRLPVRWIAQEAPSMIPGTGEQRPGGWGPEFVLSLDGRPLARTAPHGGRIDWLAEARRLAG